tara:strand:+ start:193 stop:648 length:456 start_codon:yes stop_codon:yes gene_type:complete
MYFWRIDELKKDLSNGKTNNKNIFRYYFGLTLISALGLLPFSNFENSSSEWINSLVGVAALIVSVCGSYYVNGGNNGRNFLERFIPINFVMSIRYLVFMLIAGFILGLIESESSNSDSSLLIMMIVFYILIAFKSIQNMKDVYNMQNINHD